jgi:tellurite resistance protein TerC
MLLADHYPISNLASLAVIVGILAVGIAASMMAGQDSGALVSPLAGEIERLVLSSYRQARKAVVLLVGSSVLIIGLAMVLLPGPALLVIPLGIAILAAEFTWARRWLHQMKGTMQKMLPGVNDTVRDRDGKSDQP